MNPEVKKRWCNALRSGHWRQGYGYLISEDGRRCANGVLLGLWDPSYDYKGWVNLPSQVHKWASFNIKAEVLVSELNDRHMLPFPEIADRIEVGL